MNPLPLTSDMIVGAIEIERTERGLRPHRLPQRTRERDADPQLTLMESQPSGVTVRLVTTATDIALDVHATRVVYRGLHRPRGAVDVVVDGVLKATHPLAEGDAIEHDMRSGDRSFTPGVADTIEVPLPAGGEKLVEFWLPHNEQVEVVGLRADAAVRPAPVPAGAMWVHHGSSISQGSNAATPTGIWPVVAARRAGVHLRNLGFGGSALVDPFMARVIRDTPASAISVKLGINVVNLDAMRLRSFVPAVHGFLDTIRDGHPHTPLLLVSPIFCGIHEENPGPGAFDPAGLATGETRFIATGSPGDVASGRLNLTVIREAMREIAVSRDDLHLHYLDGLSLYGPVDVEDLPLPDALHPGPEAHALIGTRFADLVLRPGGVLRPDGLDAASA